MPTKPKNMTTTRELPPMSKHTKVVVIVVGVLFVSVATYSGVLIYRNHHDHTSTNLLSSITNHFSKDKAPATKIEPQAFNNTPKSLQSAKPVTVTSQQKQELDQSQVVSNFFSGYLQNAKDGKSQDSLIAKYGTASLATQYKNAQAGFDPFTCDVSADTAKTTSFMIDGTDTVGNYTNYTLKFTTSDGYVSTSVAKVMGKGSTSLIDQAVCLQAD